VAKRRPVTRVRATCNDCGVVVVTVAAVVLEIRQGEETGTYRFECPSCGKTVRHDADREIVGILVGGGVEPETFEIPAEALEVRSGPPVSWDDILDFHFALSGDGWMAELEAGVSPTD